MPDMQTALSTALSKLSTNEMTHISNLLNTWSDAEPTITQSAAPKTDHRITNNISRLTFDLIRDNPGITRRNAVTRLTALGHKESSITSLITQFTRGGLLRKDGLKLYATKAEYSAVYKRYKKAKAKTKAKAQVVLAQVAPEPTPPIEHPEPAKPAVFISRHVDFDPKKIIGTLSVYHAIELYTELKTMFEA